MNEARGNEWNKGIVVSGIGYDMMNLGNTVGLNGLFASM
jgi:hypothetical protein